MTSFRVIPDYLDQYYLPLIGNRMIELGRKKTIDRATNTWHTYKDHFVALGYDHVSIDIKGGFGSLPLDLTQELDLEPADMVTNIGTTEHVAEQEPCWRNIHNFCAVGGVIISMTPYPGGENWWWHGEWYPTYDFYTQFADLNGYTIEVIKDNRQEPHRNIGVRMFKESSKEFTMPPEETIYRNRIRPR